MPTTKFTTVEFEKEAHARAKERGIPYPAMVQSLDSVFGGRSKRLYGEEEIASVIDLAERLAICNPQEGPAHDGRQAKPIRLTASEIVTSELLCDDLEAQVREVRKKVFGTADPPFRSYLTARRWLAQTEKTERATLGTGRATKNARSLMKKLGRLTGCSVGLRMAALEFPMKKKGQIWRDSVQALVGGNLWRLAKVMESIAKEGFTPAAVTWWILLGLRPIVPRVNVSEHHGGYRSWVTLEIHAKDFGWRELADLYKEIRSLPNLSRRRVNRLHLRIFNLVRARGGVPKIGKVEFWKAIQGSLGPKAPGTWNGVKKAYLALLKREKAVSAGS